ncbi:MAG: aspartyl protease family protein [Opitutaceae bacterium]|nr:aspartyl protease family protein [Opitutaceae bacterium]
MKRAFLQFTLAAGLVWLAGCSVMPQRRPSEPGRTTLASPLVILPAQLIGNYLLLEVKWDRHGPYRFLIDTGSSVTLVTPALAQRYPGREPFSPAATRVRVTGADGGVKELPRASLRRIDLGEARFDDVEVLVYDCAPLSAHLGVRIDGVLGFPLFRETVLTLDYPGARVILQAAADRPLLPGSAVAFDDSRKTPVVPVKIGDRTVVALIDSGSDAVFSLNPLGMEPRFASGPAEGGTIGTLGGERRRRVGRLADSLAIGEHVFREPVVDLTDELSAVGGGMLRHFAVSFDQKRDRVIFFRDDRAPIRPLGVRSAGVSFTKTPAYWRVSGVVPRSPAEVAGVQTGDLVTRINGEPVAQWELRRYDQLVATAQGIVLTFLNGTAETEKRVSVFDLVP